MLKKFRNWIARAYFRAAVMDLYVVKNNGSCTLDKMSKILKNADRGFRWRDLEIMELDKADIDVDKLIDALHEVLIELGH